MVFNDNSELSLEQIMNITGLDEMAARNQIMSLYANSKFRILLKEPNAKPIQSL